MFSISQGISIFPHYAYYAVAVKKVRVSLCFAQPISRLHLVPCRLSMHFPNHKITPCFSGLLTLRSSSVVFFSGGLEQLVLHARQLFRGHAALLHFALFLLS